MNHHARQGAEQLIDGMNVSLLLIFSIGGIRDFDIQVKTSYTLISQGLPVHKPECIGHK